MRGAGIEPARGCPPRDLSRLYPWYHRREGARTSTKQRLTREPVPASPSFSVQSRQNCHKPPAFQNSSFSGYVGSRYTEIDDLTPGIGTVNIAEFGANVGGPMTQGTFTFDPLLPAHNLVNLRFALTHVDLDDS